MKRSKFSLSNYKLLSCDMGELVPIGLTEVLPGDSIQQTTSALVRLNPLVAPVMHPVHVRIHHWFVPHRIVWDDWEDFITGGPDGEDDSVFPTTTFTGGSENYSNPIGSLADYLGVPTGINVVCSSLPFRAYNLIYNEWYRDQDLIAPLAISKASGSDTTTSTVMQNVAWEKDYFTSARPFAQKGPDITLPLGLSAPVVTTGDAFDIKAGSQAQQKMRAYDISGLNGALTYGNVSVSPPGDNVAFGTVTGLETDLTDATAVSVNDVREAFALQRYAEARARFGSRYTEYLRYLGVKSSDARLQRPEYLGGGKQTIQFSEVLQTAPAVIDEVETPVGDLRGHGISAMRTNRYRRFFEEHGYIVTCMSIKPKTIYAQGLPRTWNRRTKEDFWQKELQHIGQQEVLNKELYAAHASPNARFGYQDRYDEYRRSESTIAGEFRDTLDYWHMARIFTPEGVPALNGDFVTSTPTKRILADETSDALLVMANHSIQARRMVASTGSSFIF